MASAATSGTTRAVITATGVKIRSLEWVLTAGWMVDSMLVSGWITTWKDQGYTPGMMAESIQACIRMIRNMALGYILGLMGGVMRATGVRESSMVWVCMQCLKMAK